jgi:hypothetical protein
VPSLQLEPDRECGSTTAMGPSRVRLRSAIHLRVEWSVQREITCLPPSRHRGLDTCPGMTVVAP